MEGYSLVGGQPVKITPFDTTDKEAGTHFAPDGCAFNPIIVGGGGNPNSVETIEGTVANPWGDYGVADIISMINDDANYTIFIDVDTGSQDYIRLFPFIWRTGINFGRAYCSDSDEPSSWVADSILYSKETGEHIGSATIDGLMDEDDGTVMEGFFFLTPTILTIIHHPLPEDNT